jgi:hypothetical protein
MLFGKVRGGGGMGIYWRGELVCARYTAHMYGIVTMKPPSYY